MAEIEVLIEVLAAALKLTLEGISVVTIAVGVIFAAVRGIRSERVFAKVRLTLSRFLVLALEFQLAADVVGSAIAPTWEQIGRLAAIAAIRTFLNYFLVREMKDEEAERAKQRKRDAP
jgi:uncharacterized membrane protein